MTTARVTVVIPCFNHGAYLQEAVESVLRQTYTDIEIIVADDGSTDPLTQQVVAELRVPSGRVLRLTNGGPSAARNRAIEAASGEYVLPLDADDVIDPTYVEKAVAAFAVNPRLGIVYCRARFFGARNEDWVLPPFSFPEILWENMIFVSGMFRRRDWKACGGFSTAMTEGWEDWEFWLSLIERGCQVYQIPETLFFYRSLVASRNAQLGSHRRRADRMFGQIVRSHLELYAANASEMYARRHWHHLLHEREDVAARVGLAALRPGNGMLRRAKGGAALLAWAAYGPIRRLERRFKSDPHFR